MSFNDIDDTLVAYFKQMLEEECEQQSPEAESQVEEIAIAENDVSAQSENEQVLGSDTEIEASQVETEAVEQNDDAPQEDMDMSAAEVESESSEEYVAEDSIPGEMASQTDDVIPSESEVSSSSNVTDTEPQADASDDIDYAADDYIPEEKSSTTDIPTLQPQLQSVEEKSEPLPFAEHKSLESLLESVPKTHIVTEIAVETPTETAVETETVEETQTVTETVVEEQTQVEQVTVSESVVADESTVQAEQEAENDDAPFNWTNIEMPEEFQVLFFLVKGIRFAVPLVNLGGIFQCDKVTPLFGKPDWFQGIADIRGRKMNVVDTLKWVKSDAPQSDKYEYMISLDKTLWSIGCDVLEGNRILNKENITWRQTAGNRPWLAGIVKKEMCALLHVKALIKMFENGVNLKDLDAQMSA